MDNELSILGLNQNSGAFGVSKSSLPPIEPTVVKQSIDDELDNASVTGGNPLVASDDDLIEREWVDRAKQIVKSTQGDPFQQDIEINKLQADYISKRYSKTIGLE